jgi:signal transduction histidine kinase
MSAPEPPIASTEPLSLPLGLLQRTDGGADVVEHFRSRLVATMLLAVVWVVVLAACAVVAAGEGWLSPAQAAVAVAAGSVLGSLAALSRAYFLGRTIRPVQIAAGTGSDAAARHAGPVASQGTPPERAPGPPAVTPRDISPGFSAADDGDGSELRREVFGKLAYRLQSLVNRLIHRIDQVEQEIEDPELLKSLYAIDHLATRIRRQIENLAVLGGEAPQRRSDVPVEVNAVLRAAIAEIEHYKQVTAVPIPNAKVHGHVVAEIIHLLAELLENATTFTTPEAPKVMLRAHRVTAGLAIQVQDRGMGMSMDDITRLNRLLDGSARVDVAQLLEDGRIGLAVVEILARRHNIGAELQPNIFGGTDASIVIPHELLGDRDFDNRSPADALPSPARARHATPAGGIPAPISGPSPASRHASDVAEPHQRSLTQPRPHVDVNAARGGPPGSVPVGVPGSQQSEVSQAPRRVSDVVQGTSAGTLDHERRNADDERAPALPRRTRGESYANLRAGAANVAAGTDARTAPDPGAARSAGAAGGRHTDQATPDPYEADRRSDGSVRPPLPQRRGSHMREELRQPPPAPVRPIPGHDPTLFAAVMEGRRNAEGAHSEAPEREA